jgi:hypothetical protein
VQRLLAPGAVVLRMQLCFQPLIVQRLGELILQQQ